MNGQQHHQIDTNTHNAIPMCSKINKAPDEDAIEDGQASVVVLQSPMPAGAIPPLVELPPVSKKKVQKI